MLLNKSYRYRLCPNKSQREFFDKTFGCCRFIYNKMLEDKINYYNETNEQLKNTPAQYKSQFEFLKEVDSLALANEQLIYRLPLKTSLEIRKQDFQSLNQRKMI